MEAAANVITVVGVGVIAALLGFIYREVRGVVREFEMRLVRRDGKWWVTMKGPDPYASSVTRSRSL